MGLRGPIAELIRIEPEPLDNLDPPQWLGQIGRDYWSRHAEWLAANRILTTATADSFAMLADCWERYRTNADPRKHHETQKAYERLAKFFRLLPVDKPGTTPASRYDTRQEFTED